MKYLVLTVLLATAGFLVFAQTRDDEAAETTRVPAYTWDDLRAIDRQREALNERAHVVQRFHTCLERVKRDLWQGKTTLAAASDVLHEAARLDGDRFRSGCARGFRACPCARPSPSSC